MNTIHRKFEGSRTHDGFSLLEMMVVLGLIGAASVAFMGFFKNTQKSQKAIENNADFQRASSFLNMAFSTLDCSNMIKGLNNSSITLPLPNSLTLNQNILTGAAKVDVGKISFGDQVVFDTTSSSNKIAVAVEDAVYLGTQAIDDNSTPPVSVVYKVFNATVSMTMNNTDSYGAKTQMNFISAMLLVDGTTGVLGKCGTVAVSDQYICAQMGGIWQSTATPKCKMAASAGGDGSGVQADLTTIEAVSCSGNYQSYYSYCGAPPPCPNGKRLVPQSTYYNPGNGFGNHTFSALCIK